MGDNFGVGLRFEGVILEIGFLEALIIFNDAIVHNGDLAFWPEMRMGVFVGWLAVGGPTSVAYADVPGEGMISEGLFEIGKFSFSFFDGDGMIC